MNYKIERYRNCERFNKQYEDIHHFLLNAEKYSYNEHFHWGRFEWMHTHSMLDADKLTSIVMFKDEADVIVGLLTYDTSYDDRFYLIHTTEDKGLLDKMIDTVLEMDGGEAVVKVNSKDAVLEEMLRSRDFVEDYKEFSILELDMRGDLEYRIPDEYHISPKGYQMDNWQYQMVIYKGFENEGIPEPWCEELINRNGNHINQDLRVFAVKDYEYCAHCGLWFTEGTTAYVEPVATIPEHRMKGLAKAVIYEACKRAKGLGARRATVISDQEFYYRIGFSCSSEVYCWKKIP